AVDLPEVAEVLARGGVAGVRVAVQVEARGRGEGVRGVVDRLHLALVRVREDLPGLRCERDLPALVAGDGLLVCLEVRLHRSRNGHRLAGPGTGKRRERGLDAR